MIPISRLEAVNLRLLKLGVHERDMTEQFIHAGGKGGQNVNKVSSAVRLTCAKENIEVKCMEERSQGLNRIRAREIMAERIEKKRDAARQAAKAEALNLKKKKAGRPKSIKRMILRDKRKNSQRKNDRKYRPGSEE